MSGIFKQIPNKIIISRTDNIGDVVLTLPLCYWLKKEFPNCEIIFLCKSYTEPIVKMCSAVNEIILLDKSENLIESFSKLKADTIIHVFPSKEIAYSANKAKIKNRIGTSHRVYHWLYCNKLVNVGRKKSDLHESQLNIALAAKAMEVAIPSLEEVAKLIPKLETNKSEKTIKKIVFHPKSKGSAREWDLEHFTELAKLFVNDNIEIFVSGTEAEGKVIREKGRELLNLPNVIDITGKYTLSEFIEFIKTIDVLIAASTGPLHIAAFLGKKTIGVYPNIRPLHAGRWAPIGDKAVYLTTNTNCSECKKSDKCTCMQNISAQMVYDAIFQSE